MPVYIDDANIPAEVQNGSVTHASQWSHLVADTPRELHDFATRTLGLKRSYFQDHWPYPHYDLTSGQRQQALAKGAQPVEYGGNGIGVGKWLPPVLVTSSRDGLTVADVEAALRPVFDLRKVLISGGARGGDRIAETLWQKWGGEIDRHKVAPGDWATSRQAGHDRNGVMVEKAARRQGEVVAIHAPCTDDRCARTGRHGSHGTENCLKKARAAGLSITHHRVPEPGGLAARRAAPKPARHDWQPTGDPDRQRCRGCEIEAIRIRDGGQVRIDYLVPGLPPTAEVPPCFRTLDAQAGPDPEVADPPVQDECGDGTGPGGAAESSAAPAALSEVVDTGTVISRGRYDETVQCGCGGTFRRPTGAAYGECLGCEMKARNATAGPWVADGIRRIQEWNQQVRGPRREAARVPDREAAG